MMGTERVATFDAGSPAIVKEDVSNTEIGQQLQMIEEQLDRLNNFISHLGNHIDPILLMERPSPGEDSEGRAPESQLGNKLYEIVIRLTAENERLQDIDRRIAL